MSTVRALMLLVVALAIATLIGLWREGGKLRSDAPSLVAHSRQWENRRDPVAELSTPVSSATVPLRVPRLGARKAPEIDPASAVSSRDIVEVLDYELGLGVPGAKVSAYVDRKWIDLGVTDARGLLEYPKCNVDGLAVSGSGYLPRRIQLQAPAAELETVHLKKGLAITGRVTLPDSTAPAVESGVVVFASRLDRVPLTETSLEHIAREGGSDGHLIARVDEEGVYRLVGLSPTTKYRIGAAGLGLLAEEAVYLPVPGGHGPDLKLSYLYAIKLRFVGVDGADATLDASAGLENRERASTSQLSQQPIRLGSPGTYLAGVPFAAQPPNERTFVFRSDADVPALQKIDYEAFFVGYKPVRVELRPKSLSHAGLVTDTILLLEDGVGFGAVRLSALEGAAAWPEVGRPPVPGWGEVAFFRVRTALPGETSLNGGVAYTYTLREFPCDDQVIGGLPGGSYAVVITLPLGDIRIPAGAPATFVEVLPGKIVDLPITEVLPSGGVELVFRGPDGRRQFEEVHAAVGSSSIEDGRPVFSTMGQVKLVTPPYYLCGIKPGEHMLKLIWPRTQVNAPIPIQIVDGQMLQVTIDVDF